MSVETQLERLIEMQEATQRLLISVVRKLDSLSPRPRPAEPVVFPKGDEVPYDAIRAALADPQVTVARVVGGKGPTHSRVMLAPETWLKIEHNEWGAVQRADLVYPDGTEMDVDPVRAGMAP